MLKIYSFSEIGFHRVNEDAFQFAQHPLDSNVWMVVLADGQGGRSGGERAAQLACRLAMEMALAHSPQELANPKTWTALLKQADCIVASDSDAGYTTLIGFSVAGDCLIGASSGDSALLGISGGVNVEYLTEAQVKNPPVGSGEAIFVTYAFLLSRPWKLLAMSDGVWKYVGWKPMIDVALRENGDKLVAELQRLGRLSGSGRFQDDFTLVLMERDIEPEPKLDMDLR